MKEKSISNFVAATANTVKDEYKFIDWTSERIERLISKLVQYEDDAKRIMKTSFPAAEFGLFVTGKSVQMSSGDILIFRTTSSIDTTSRNPEFYGSTDYRYTISLKSNYAEKVIASDMRSSRSRWNTPAEVKTRCKVEALLRYLHIDLS